MIDQEILHYKIQEKLGEGGMGEVYKATDLKLGLAWWLKPDPVEDRQVRRFTMSMEGFRMVEDVDISPDGRQIAFYGTDSSAKAALHLFNFESGETHYLEGTNGNGQPQFSPDGRSLVLSLIHI